ncbi:MAG: MBL fold metallo-hydrolase [Culturomica sp.]|nr:MBL fold metallo-hydrolase [Culturomica sp.]
MSHHISFRRNEGLLTVKPYWKGNPVVRGRFVNRYHRKKQGIGSVLKWRFSPNPQRKEKRREKWDPEIDYLHSLQDLPGNFLVWLGHNSFYLQIGGKRFMFDPVFGNIPFVRRQSKLPVNPELFKNVDYLLLSHDHFDHTDKKSIGRLYRNNPRMKVFAGLGTGALIRKWSPGAEVIEAGWYQQLADGDIKITFLPSQHWGKRSVQDGGKRLWGAFLIAVNGISLYYSGDTGYSEHFSEVRELFGAPDYALLGIGAYKPRWFMQPNHISPYDSLTASEKMGAGITIPMHYGTFDLSDEPLSDPPKVFAEEAGKRNIRIAIPRLGEIVSLNPIH